MQGQDPPRRRPHLSRSRRSERVRIVDIGDFSRELCGGTHVARCSQVGAFRLLTELSIGSNLCRVEALTGHSTLTRLDTERRLLCELSTTLGIRPQGAPTAFAQAPGGSRRRPDATDLLSSADQLRGWMASPEALAGRGLFRDFHVGPGETPGTFRRVNREGHDSAERYGHAVQGPQPQHSMMFTASPPRAVSLYLTFMRPPVRGNSLPARS
ncbi:hypothetical protein ACWGJW_15130 [Streptomyces nigrescens]